MLDRESPSEGWISQGQHSSTEFQRGATVDSTEASKAAVVSAVGLQDGLQLGGVDFVWVAGAQLVEDSLEGVEG